MKLSILVPIPIRLIVGVLTFMICFVAYMLRANISIEILAMVHKDEDDPDVSFPNQFFLKIQSKTVFFPVWSTL